jgi:hypothetical protein
MWALADQVVIFGLLTRSIVFGEQSHYCPSKSLNALLGSGVPKSDEILTLPFCTPNFSLPFRELAE